MLEKLEALIDIYNSDLDIDISRKVLHFETINDCLFNLTNELFENNVKIKYHQSELESKVFRHGVSNQSIISLVKGIKFKLLNRNVELVDTTSIKTLTRMQIESFLVMFYLFFDDDFDIEKDFRYDIYKLHGLQKQKNFKETSISNQTIENRKKIESEIDNCMFNITNSEIFKKSNEKEKKNYQNPNKPKLIDGKELFIKSKIEKSRINEIWSLYSNISHSEHIGDRQFNHYKLKPSANIESTSFLLNINSILTSNLILYLRSTFECIANQYNNLEPMKKTYIETWSQVGTRKKE